MLTLVSQRSLIVATDSPVSASPAAEPRATTTPRPRRRRRRVLLFSLGGVLLVVLALVALAPTIASSLAPGIIESSVNSTIKGSIDVDRVRVGWFKPAEAGPIRLLDDRGDEVASLEARTGITVMDALSGRMWASKDLDLGNITLAGGVAVVQEPDGTTNLERALAPREQNKQGQPSGSTEESEGRAIRGTLTLDTLTLTQAVRPPSGPSDDVPSRVGPPQGVRDLAGSIDFALDTRQGLDLTAKGRLAGTPVGAASSPDAPAAQGMTVDIDTVIASAPGAGSTLASLENAKVNLNVAAAPVGLIDGLAGMGGALLETAGQTADLRVNADGDLRAFNGRIVLESEGATLNLPVRIENGVLEAGRSVGAPAAEGAAPAQGDPGILTIRSLEGLAKVPALRPTIERMRQTVQLDQAPSLRVDIETIRIPSPVTADGKPTGDLKSLDFRGSSAIVRIQTSGMSGRVSAPAPGAGATPSDAQAATQATWQPFTLEPVDLVVSAPDLAQGLQISTSTRATLNGSAAGELSLRANAGGLLDDQGHLRALSATPGSARPQDMLGSLDAQASATGVSTALLQPLIAAADLPIDVNEDIGPTASLRASARLTQQATPSSPPPKGAPGKTGDEAATGLASLPPLDADFTLESRNMNGAGAITVFGGVVRTAENGITLRINSAAPLARRFTLDEAGNDPGLIAGGAGAMELRITDLVADLNKLRSSPVADDKNAAKTLPTADGALVANIEASLRDLAIRLPAPAPVDVAAAAGAAPAQPAPININQSTFALRLPASGEPRITLNADMAVEGEPFAARGDIALPGLAGGKAPPSGPGVGPIDQLLAIKPTGEIVIDRVPQSIVRALPGMPAPAEPGATDYLAVARGLIGQNATVTLATAPEGDAQTARLNLTTQSQAVGADVATSISRSQIKISRAEAFLKPRPDTFNAVLPSSPSGGAQAPGAIPPRPMQLAMETAGAAQGDGAITARITDEITIPVKKDAAGASQPDLAAMSDARIEVRSTGALLVNNVVVGGDGSPTSPYKYLDLRLTDVQATADLPAGSLRSAGEGKSAKPITASMQAAAARQDGQPLGRFDADLTADAGFANLKADANVKDLALATLDDTLGTGGLLQGFIGDTANIRVEADMTTPPGAAPAPAPARPANQDQDARAPAPPAGPARTIALDASIEAPRVQGASIKLIKDAASLRLTQPADITITPDTTVLNRLSGASDLPPVIAQPTPADAQPAGGSGPNPIRGIGKVVGGVGSAVGLGGSDSKPSEPAKPAAVTKIRVLDAAPMRLRIDRLVIPSAVAPGAPALELGANFTTERLGLEFIRVATDNSASFDPVQVTFGDIRGSATTPESGALTAQIAFGNVQSTVNGQTLDSGKPSTVNVSITGLRSPSGALSTEQAVVSADADIATFPTAVVDSVAGQGGLLAELLGPTVNAQARARNISMAHFLQNQTAGGSTGTIEATADAPRAQAQIKGTIEEGRFVQAAEPQTFSIRVVEIRPQLVTQLAGSVPVIQSLEKTAQDEPAVITGRGLEVPLDKNLSKLNGDLNVDLGVARFTTQNIFGRLLKMVGAQNQGVVGRRIEPFMVHMSSGVVNYDRFKLPLGEFDLQTDGQVDLVEKKIRVTTYAPFFAIAEEGLGPIKLGLAGKIDLIDKHTLVPITTSGPLSNPETKIDAERFIKEVGKNIFSAPGNILEGILGGGDKNKPAAPVAPGSDKQPSSQPATTPPPKEQPKEQEPEKRPRRNLKPGGG